MCSCFKSNGPSLFLGVWGLKGKILVVVNLIEEHIFDWTSEETQTKQSATKTNNYSNYLLVTTYPNRKSRVNPSRLRENTNSGTSWYAIGPHVMVHRFLFSNLHLLFKEQQHHYWKVIGGRGVKPAVSHGSVEAYHETRSKWPGYDWWFPICLTISQESKLEASHKRVSKTGTIVTTIDYLRKYCVFPSQIHDLRETVPCFGRWDDWSSWWHFVTNDLSIPWCFMLGHHENNHKKWPTANERSLDSHVKAEYQRKNNLRKSQELRHERLQT